MKRLLIAFAAFATLMTSAMAQKSESLCPPSSTFFSSKSARL